MKPLQSTMYVPVLGFLVIKFAFPATFQAVKDDKENSPLWGAIPASWGKKDKYKEIKDYVENILERAYQ